MSMKVERNRETRRASILGSNGFNRRGLRTSSLTGSPEYGGGVEWPESVRLRGRVKRHRDRERGRDFRERASRSRRRRVHDETSEESLNDDEDDDGDEATATASATAAGRLFLPSPPSGSVSTHHHLQLRRSFPPGFSSSSTSKVFGATHVWRPSDEIIGVTVPRKPRSASAKRSRDWNSSRNDGSCAGGAEQILRRASSSPASQPGCASTSAPPPAVPMSPPSSSNSFFKKKLKSGGSNTEPKLKPPMASSSTGHASSSAAEDLEFEIAEVLFGLMTQSQGPSEKDKSEEVQRSKGDVKSASISDSGSLQAVEAPARKRLRPMAEKTGEIARIDPSAAEFDMDQPPESEILSSSGSEKVRGSASGNGLDGRGNSVNSDGWEAQAQPQDVKDRESGDVKNEDDFCSDSSLTATASSSVADSITVKTNLLVSEEGTQREQKFEFDLMALPPQARSSSPESSAPSDQPPDPTLSTAHAESKPMVCKDEENLLAEEKNIKRTNEETESCKKIDSQPQEIMPVQMNKEGSAAEKSGQPESPISSGCADGLLFIGHMAPPKNSATVSPSSTRRLTTLPSLKRCARHFLIARNIERHQKLMKMDPSRNRADKGLARTPDHVVKEKGGPQIVTSSNVVENKKQLVIQNQKSTLGPISLNQHKAARPISLSNPVGPTSSMDTSQYLQLLQNNNAYHLPTSGSRAHTNILGQNFARPVHPQLLVQNQAIFQSFPEATRQQHIQSNNFVIAEGNKLGIRDDKAERENLAEKAQHPIIPLMSSNFPQNLTQTNNGCLVRSPYWSYSSKTPFSQSQPQTQNQISFGANQKLPTTARGQSPTNSSVSTKTGQNPIFSPQLPKNFSSNGMTPMQAQLFFTNPYSQVRFPHHSAVTSSGLSGPNGIYIQQTTNDPSKAIVGANSDATGGRSIHTARIGGTRLPAVFSYIRPVVQGASQMKPAEQK